MTRLIVTTEYAFGYLPGTILYDAEWSIREWDHVPAWAVPIGDDGYVYFAPSEVVLLPDVKHRGPYDDQHPGEQEPDAYDRMSHKYEDHGRHLLHTGVE